MWAAATGGRQGTGCDREQLAQGAQVPRRLSQTELSSAPSERGSATPWVPPARGSPRQVGTPCPQGLQPHARVAGSGPVDQPGPGTRGLGRRGWAVGLDGRQCGHQRGFSR